MVTELVRRPHARNLVRWAATRPEVLVLSADLTASCEADDFRDAYPERFFSLGVAEQNMVSLAAGLAREGFRPYLHTFGVFLTRRTFDQVAMTLGYSYQPVRLLGFLPGLTTPGGVTHQATDDIALMRAVPNMTVVEVGDATEVESVLDATEHLPGPLYLRMLRGEVPRLFPVAEPLQVGVHRRLRAGSDLLLVSSGICTEEAQRAVAALAEQGVAVEHWHVSTLKPFSDAPLLEAASRCRHGVITLENHSVVGGLGSALAERMAEEGLGRRLLRLALPDRYLHGASRAFLMRETGIDARGVVEGVERLLGQRLDLDLTAPTTPAPPPVVQAAPAKAEDL